MKKSIYIYVVLISFIFSCQVDNTTNDNQVDNFEAKLDSKLTVREFRKLMRKSKAEGSILLQSNSNAYTQYNNRTVSISEKFGEGNRRTTTKSLVLIDENNDVISFDKETGRSQSNDLLNIYGSTIKMYQDDNGTRIAAAEEVYVPELLMLNINSDTIEAGTEINWNVDLLNEDGVIIYVVYDPKLQSDLNKAYDNQQMIIEAFTVSETQGSYVITDSDLMRFPENVDLDITIARGAFSLNDNPDNPSFIAVSQVMDSKPLRK